MTRGVADSVAPVHADDLIVSSWGHPNDFGNRDDFGRCSWTGDRNELGASIPWFGCGDGRMLLNRTHESSPEL